MDKLFSRSVEKGRGVAPYALAGTKASLQAVQSLAALANAPCVAPVISVALQVITIAEVQSHSGHGRVCTD